MVVHKKKKPQLKNFLVPATVVLVIIGGIGFVAKVMLTDTGPPRKNKITTVSLVKPPEQTEKLPEPEPPKDIPKPQEMDTPIIDQPQDAPQQASDAPDDAPPAGSDLGVDAEGGAGSDGFGLVGRKGGRAITLGGGGGGGGSGMNRLSLLAKYGWYTKKVQDEIRGKVKAILDESGGFPKGKYQTVVKLTLDVKGVVVDHRIVGSSGNSRMDDAVRQSVAIVRISEVPPDGMPRTMTIRISSQG